MFRCCGFHQLSPLLNMNANYIHVVWLAAIAEYNSPNMFNLIVVVSTRGLFWFKRHLHINILSQPTECPSCFHISFFGCCFCSFCFVSCFVNVVCTHRWTNIHTRKTICNGTTKPYFRPKMRPTFYRCFLLFSLQKLLWNYFVNSISCPSTHSCYNHLVRCRIELCSICFLFRLCNWHFRWCHPI